MWYLNTLRKCPSPLNNGVAMKFGLNPSFSSCRKTPRKIMLNGWKDRQSGIRPQQQYPFLILISLLPECNKLKDFKITQ